MCRLYDCQITRRGLLGDALLHPVLSFQRPRCPAGADQDPKRAIETRLALLDRANGDKLRLLGFHLPWPGFGRAERLENAYRVVPESE